MSKVLCENCEGDGYLEEWNKDQTGVTTELFQFCEGTGEVEL